jgi:glyoxylase-like metal-dependent hydrolase (beta-lactamase superfamily II)
MMSFVIVTEKNNAIVIDGGRPEDMPLLKQYVGERHISAWILTHPHLDHISGFINEMKKNNCADFDVERVVYAFPSSEGLKAAPDVPCRSYFEADVNDILPNLRAQLGIMATSTPVTPEK